VLGAKRAGISKIVLPRRNEIDLDDVPKEVRDTMTFTPVEEISEVFVAAFGVPIVHPATLGEGTAKSRGNVVPMRGSLPSAGNGERKRTPATRTRTAVSSSRKR
jgi:predicted ATP-dependent protease